MAVAASRAGWKEYRTMQCHCQTIIDNLGRTVDPALFARRLQEQSLINDDIVQAASVEVLTKTQRIAPVVDAVLAQIRLKADLFHTFMTVLKDENVHLWEILDQYYSSSLDLNAMDVLTSISGWEELGHQLQVCPVKMSQLVQRGGDTEHCREEVVQEWLKDKTASWEKLCRALERMGNVESVQLIKERYISNPCYERDSPDSSHCLQEVIVDQVQRFNDRFSALVFRLRNEMLRNETPVILVQDSLALLPTTIRTEHYQFVKECSEDIHKANDIKDLFRHLNLYWTYLEYSLLDHIIVRHSNTLSISLKEDMERYKKDMNAFKQCTTVEQILKVDLGCIRREPPPGFSRIITKLKRKASEYTLQELEVFRKQVCVEFNLPNFILMLESVDEGSLCIKWHIPSSEVDCFFTISSSILERISPELFHLEVDMNQYLAIPPSRSISSAIQARPVAYMTAEGAMSNFMSSPPAPLFGPTQYFTRPRGQPGELISPFFVPNQYASPLDIPTLPAVHENLEDTLLALNKFSPGNTTPQSTTPTTTSVGFVADDHTTDVISDDEPYKR